MRRLLATDISLVPGRVVVYHVLERPPLPVGKADIRLSTGKLDGSSEAFLAAKDFQCMRFWIDVDNELGRELHRLFTPQDFAHIEDLTARAKMATASVLRARREALKILRDQFAAEIEIPVDRLFGIENGRITITAPLLDQIEVVFARREMAMGYTPNEMSARLARELSASALPGDRTRTNGTAHARVQATVQTTVRPQDLPMLPEPPVSENQMPRDNEAGAELHALRKARGISRRSFAQMARMQPNHVARLESGDLEMTPEVEQRYKLTNLALDRAPNRVLS